MPRIRLLARGVLRSGRFVLLAHNKRKTHTFLPGGRIEPGESAGEALAREFREETGLRVRVGAFLGVVEHAWREQGKRRHELNLIFEVTAREALGVPLARPLPPGRGQPPTRAAPHVAPARAAARAPPLLVQDADREERTPPSPPGRRAAVTRRRNARRSLHGGWPSPLQPERLWRGPLSRVPGRAAAPVYTPKVLPRERRPGTAEQERRSQMRYRKEPPALLAAFLLGLLCLPACDKDKDKDKDKPKPATPPAAEPAKKDEAAKPDPEGWVHIFDGKTLKDWKETGYPSQPKPRIENAALILPAGQPMTGVTYTGKDVPKMNYEISLEAQLVDGSDFFCGLTFPVAESFASLVCGGWGGSVTGISSLDGNDAANNETARMIAYEKGKWYHFEVRVLETRLKVWVDAKEIVNVRTKGRKVETRWEMDDCHPFGLASYYTTGAIRDLKVRKLNDQELESEKQEDEKDKDKD
jgi:ADP-ribose pyrophosphatase YjhB (NUDIX family)